MATVWIVTREHNLYDQHGEYFEAAFTNRPNTEDLLSQLPHLNHTELTKLVEGGGRVKSEEVWYYLREEKLN